MSSRKKKAGCSGGFRALTSCRLKKRYEKLSKKAQEKRTNRMQTTEYSRSPQKSNGSKKRTQG